MSIKQVLAKIFRKHRGKNTRLTIPFDMLCTNCTYQLPKGQKHYSNRILSNETYLGIEIFLFEMVCPNCKCKIIFQTNPKDGIYEPTLNCKEVKVEDKVELNIKNKERVVEDYEEMREKVCKNF